MRAGAGAGQAFAAPIATTLPGDSVVAVAPYDDDAAVVATTAGGHVWISTVDSAGAVTNTWEPPAPFGTSGPITAVSDRIYSGAQWLDPADGSVHETVSITVAPGDVHDYLETTGVDGDAPHHLLWIAAGTGVYRVDLGTGAAAAVGPGAEGLVRLLDGPDTGFDVPPTEAEQVVAVADGLPPQMYVYTGLAPAPDARAIDAGALARLRTVTQIGAPLQTDANAIAGGGSLPITSANLSDARQGELGDWLELSPTGALTRFAYTSGTEVPIEHEVPADRWFVTTDHFVAADTGGAVLRQFALEG